MDSPRSPTSTLGPSLSIAAALHDANAASRRPTKPHNITIKHPHNILVRAWLACQVELTGRYSVQRMLALDAYTRVSTAWRVFSLFVLTIVPCLLAVILLECLPLAPIEDGLRNSRNFWIRTAIGTAMVTYPMVAQFHQSIPDLDLSPKSILCISVVTAISLQPVLYVMATYVGFPIPFFVILGMGPWTVVVTTVTGFVLRRQLRRDASIRTQVRKYWKISAAQGILILTYPSYSYVFNQLSASSQTGFALLLPLIKLALKNLFSYTSRHIEDLRPELIVFNVEIFSSLYVSACMQSATSIYTTLVITGVDFVQACFSIKDLYDVLDDPNLQVALRSEDPTDSSGNSYTRLLIPLTMHIVQTNRAIRNHPSIQLQTCGPQADIVIKNAAIRLTQIAPGGLPLLENTPAQLTQSEAGSTHQPPAPFFAGKASPRTHFAITTFKSSFRAITSRTARRKSAFLGEDSFYVRFLNHRIKEDHQELLRIAGRLTDDQQLLVVQKTLRVLHIAEFIALIEYSEVFVPIVYSIFCVIAYSFSNRIYFTMVSSLSTATFVGTLSNVLIYGSLELVSYVGLNYVLRHKFHLSAFAQTAFVLETQWTMVQPKLLLWMVVVMQFALVHYGNDFSFQFQWLSHNDLSDE